jgi:hypothetical protein
LVFARWRVDCIRVGITLFGATNMMLMSMTLLLGAAAVVGGVSAVLFLLSVGLSPRALL